MIICRYFIMFILFSFVGWVWESIHAIFKIKSWERRGFLYGPICPIYGITFIIILILHENVVLWNNKDIHSIFVVFIISFISIAIIEYVTSYILEKIFNAVWWDYSDLPLNINGRICLPVSLFFGLAGIIIYYIIVPFANACFLNFDPIVIEILALSLMFIFSMDISITVSVLSDFEKYIVGFDEKFNNKMTELVNNGITNNIESINKFLNPKFIYIASKIKSFKFDNKIINSDRINNLLTQIKSRMNNNM